MKICFNIYCLAIFLALPTSVFSQTIENKDDTLLRVVDIPASFPGGEKSFLNFLSEHIEYPDFAVEQHIEGTVFVKFVINVTGNIIPESIEIVKTPHESFNNTVIDTFKKSPAWSVPKMADGTAVKQLLIIPVRFSLEKKKKRKRG